MLVTPHILPKPHILEFGSLFSEAFLTDNLLVIRRRFQASLTRCIWSRLMSKSRSVTSGEVVFCYHSLSASMSDFGNSEQKPVTVPLSFSTTPL